jgi:hypothetical protein
MAQIVRRRAAAVLTVAGALGAAAATALPWARSGRAERSGFALARLADALGAADRFPLRGLVIAVAFLPALAAATWVAGVLGRRGLMAGLGAMTGAVALVGALVVWRTPVETEYGAPLAAASGVLALVGVGVVLTGRNE